MIIKVTKGSYMDLKKKTGKKFQVSPPSGVAQALILPEMMSDNTCCQTGKFIQALVYRVFIGGSVR